MLGCDDEDFSDLFSEVEVLLSIEISDGLIDVSVDGNIVPDEVLAHNLDEGGGFNEDLSPGAELHKVVVNSLAGLYSLGKSHNELLSLHECLRVTSEVVLLEVINHIVNDWGERLSISDALLEFSQVIFVDDTIDNTGNDINDSTGGDGVGSVYNDCRDEEGKEERLLHI